jgi:hypothetical protein
MTNAFTPENAPTMRCRRCQQYQPVSMMLRDVRASGKHRDLCKPCANEQRQASRERIRELSACAPPKPEREPTVAGPRVPLVGITNPLEPRPYYRNEGNRHIRSRGV